MSEIRVDSITSKTGSNPVSFTTGISGVGTYLSFAPKVVQFSPEPFAVGVSTTANIVVTFDQDIEFVSPSGTIELRKDSAGGSLIESYTTGSSARLSITGNELTIDPTNNLLNGEKYFVILPSSGIGNTFGNVHSGTNTYSFETLELAFSVSGGTHEFTRADPASPTGYYKYHVFTSTGPLVLTSPSLSATNSAILMVGGGGGGGSYPGSNYHGGGGGAGGLIYETNFILEKGSYTVTIGAGGAGHSPTTTGGGLRGQNTTISSSPTVNHFIAFGGGADQYSNTHSQLPGASPGGSPGWQGPLIAYSYGTQGNPGAGGLDPTVGSAGGGGGGAGTAGLPSVSFPAPGGPNGLGYRGGAGGSGRSIAAFTSPILSGNVPTIPAPSLSKIGPTGLYAGGGGGGAGLYPSYPGSPFTAGAGGPGGGGHGSYVNTTYSPFTPSFPTNQSTAESGYQHTGGGGGGSVGPYISYPAGNGGSGVVMIRYSSPA